MKESEQIAPRKKTANQALLPATAILSQSIGVEQPMPCWVGHHF